MKIHGHPMSTCTRKVLMTMIEKGHKPDLALVDFAVGAHKQPAHMEHQPFGRIPALEDDGFWLYESRAIARYLDGKLGGPALTPADAKDRARMEQWISVETSEFTPLAMKIIYQLVINKMFGKEADMAVVEQAKKDLALPLGVLDKALAGHEYLAGSFSLADIAYMPYIEYLNAAGVWGDLTKDHKNVAAWWARCSARPAWKQVTSN